MPEQKSCILVETAPFTAFPSSGEWVLRTYSPPVILISHVDQEPRARGTIFWDSAFALWVDHVGRVPFEVPEQVTWGDFKKALSNWFAGSTGRGLSDLQLHALGIKLGILFTISYFYNKFSISSLNIIIFKQHKQLLLYRHSCQFNRGSHG